MENALYTGLTRQSGLLTEMQIIANNLANAQTTGFRAQGIAFSEFIAPTGYENDSLSMAAARVGLTNFAQGTQSQTNAPLDIAIEGEGFFLVEMADGQRALTRNGHFQISADGILQTSDGLALLDASQTPIALPAVGGTLSIAQDGTLSMGTEPFGQIGLFAPADPNLMERSSGALFVTPEVLPVENGSMRQGFLEASNVDPILQLSRMIEVQRAYELGQSFSAKEDERIRQTIQLMKG